MKKMFLTILSGIIIISLILGSIILWTNITNRRININTASINPLTSKGISLSNPQRIDFSVRTAVVQIKSGTSSKLQFDNISNDQYHLTKHNNILKITENNALKHQLEIGKSPKITLTIPQKAIDSLVIEQLNGTLKLNDLTIDHLKIHHHNGTTLSKNLTIKSTSKLIKDNGETTLTNLNVSGLVVNVKTGQFKLNGKKQIKNYRDSGHDPLTINSGSGQVSVTN